LKNCQVKTKIENNDSKFKFNLTQLDNATFNNATMCLYIYILIYIQHQIIGNLLERNFHAFCINLAIYAINKAKRFL